MSRLLRATGGCALALILASPSTYSDAPSRAQQDGPSGGPTRTARTAPAAIGSGTIWKFDTGG